MYLRETKKRLMATSGSLACRADNGGITSELDRGIWNYNHSIFLSKTLENPNRRKPVDGSTDALTNSRGINDQSQALRDFLAVYASTQADNVPDNGSLDEQIGTIQSGKTDDQRQIIQVALFGDGTQAGGLIDNGSLLLGGLDDHMGGIGAHLSAETLAAIMDSTIEKVDNWVGPINEAMKKIRNQHSEENRRFSSKCE